MTHPAGGAASPTAWPNGYPALRVRHLWHRFGPREVLRDVTFDVAQGEIFGFIGPNGAGKTTTIRIMSTLLEPMAGRVEVEGIDVTMEPEKVRRLIGYMPDHAGVYERITVREFLEFFADAYRIPSLQVVDAVLELADIQPLQDQLVATLSKGQKQRLQLARILLHDPQVLILDEPASDLDPRARIEIRDLLLDLQSLGKTIFLSSHILSELSDVCSSVGIIEHGRIVVAGPLDEIADRLAAQQAAQAQGQASPAAPGVQPWQAPPGQQVAAAPVTTAPGEAPGPAALVPAEAIAPVGQAAHRGTEVPGAPGTALAPAGAPLPVAAAQPRRRGVKLRVLGDPSAAAFSLQGGPGIVDVQVVGPAVHVGYTGGDEKVAEIVRHLVHRNFGVISVEQERNELERIFLEATRQSGGNS